MKKLMIATVVFMNLSAFAATDASIVASVFNNPNFVTAMGEDKLEDISISQQKRGKYLVVVNADARLADGCSYSATVTESSESYAINPATSGVRTILKASKTKAECARRR